MCTYFGQGRTIYFEIKMSPSNHALQNNLESLLAMTKENFPYV